MSQETAYASRLMRRLIEGYEIWWLIVLGLLSDWFIR